MYWCIAFIQFDVTYHLDIYFTVRHVQQRVYIFRYYASN